MKYSNNALTRKVRQMIFERAPCLLWEMGVNSGDLLYLGADGVPRVLCHEHDARRWLEDALSEIAPWLVCDPEGE